MIFSAIIARICGRGKKAKIRREVLEWSEGPIVRREGGLNPRFFGELWRDMYKGARGVKRRGRASYSKAGEEGLPECQKTRGCDNSRQRGTLPCRKKREKKEPKWAIRPHRPGRAKGTHPIQGVSSIAA